MDAPGVTVAEAQLILTNAPHNPPTPPAPCTDTGPSLIELEQHCHCHNDRLRVAVGLSWAQEAECQDLLQTWD